VIVPILRYPDPRLSLKAAPVRDGEPLDALIENLLDTMKKNNGAGLAAPQIGVALRVFVLSEETSPTQQVFVNPSWFTHGTGGRISSEDEGCLSFPGVRITRPRYPHVMVHAWDRRRQMFELVLSDFAAFAVQHENDHLDGVLMADGMPRGERRRIAALVRRGRA